MEYSVVVVVFVFGFLVGDGVDGGVGDLLYVILKLFDLVIVVW